MASGKNESGSEKWYLRKSDGSEYGPASLDDIARWAAESRVVSGNAVSRDRKEWLPVEDVPALGMEWTAHLADGRKYGPFNVLATRDLHHHKVLPADARLVHGPSGEESTVGEWLKRPADEQAAAPASSQPVGPDRDADAGGAEAADAAVTADGDTDAAEPGASAAEGARKRRRSRRRADGSQRELWDTSPRESAAEVAGDAAEAAEMVAEVAAPDAAEADGSDMDVPRDEDAAAGAGDDAGSNDAEAAVTEVAPIEDPGMPDEDEDGALADVDADAAHAEEDAVEAARRDAEALRGRVAALDSLVAATAKQLKHAEGARTKAEAELDRLRAEVSAAADEQRRVADEHAARVTAAEERVRQAEAARADIEAARQDLVQQLADLESRLQAAGDEIQAARADEAKATAALRGGEAANLRKTQIFEKRIKDLLDERSALTRLVEKQGVSLKLLRLAATACLIVAVAAVAFGVLAAIRGCSRAAPTAAGKAAGAPAATAMAPTAAESRRAALPIVNAVPGTRVAYDRTGCAVFFDAGVFSAGTTIAPAAVAALQRMAPQLKPYVGEFDLVVEGYTDNEPVTRDSRYGSNADLAMARARAFSRILSADFGIPLASMRAVAGDVARAPYPNDTEASRARNRTVVLRLVRHAGN